MASKINVLHIAAWWPDQSNPRMAPFIQEHIASTAERCVQHVVHLRFVKSTTPAFPTIKHAFEEDHFRLHRITVSSPVRRFGLHEWLVQKGFAHAFNVLADDFDFQPDIVHFHVRSHLTRIAIDLCMARSLPMILSEHFSYYQRGFFALEAKEQHQEKAMIHRQFNAPNMRRIMPVSHDLKERLKHEFGVTSPITVVPNIAHEVFIPKNNIKRNKHHFVACATWSEPKDPLLMLNAIQELDQKLPVNFHLDIIGGGDLIPAMKAFVKEHLNDVSIAFHGNRPKQFIAEKLRMAEALLHPTRRENLPAIIIESLCCGTPVVSMNLNGIPELIDDTNGILVAREDQAAFGKAILDTSHISFDHTSIAASALALYSSEEVGKQIMAIYRSILDEAAQESPEAPLILMLLDNPLTSDKRVEKEALALREAGFNVRIIATHNEHLPTYDATKDGIPIERLLGTWIAHPFGLNYNKLLKAFVHSILERKAAVIYGHDHFTAAILSQVKRINPLQKVVYDNHEYLRGWPYYREIRSPWNRFKGFLVWRQLLAFQNDALKRADAVIAPTESIAIRLQQDAKLNAQPIHVMNVTDEQIEERIDVKALLEIGADQLLVAHAGSIYQSDEQLQRMIAAFEQHNAAHLVFISNRPKFFHLKEEAQRQNQQRTHFIEYDRFPILNLLAGCDAGIVHLRSAEYLNHRITSSNKFTEYIRAGIPMLSCPNELHEALNKQHPFISFYDEMDPASFPKALDELVHNIESYRRGAEAIQDELSWQKEVQKLVIAVNELVGNPIKNHSK